MPFNDTKLHWDLEMLFFRWSVSSEPQILSFHCPGDQVVYENLVLAGISNPDIPRLWQFMTINLLYVSLDPDFVARPFL